MKNMGSIIKSPSRPTLTLLRPLLSLSLILLVTNTLSHAFILEGSDTSYARFSRWNVNTTLSFEFTTNQPDGLLLYTDDGGKTDFFELKLVEGILRLRFNLLNQGTQLVNIGHHLNDGLWHRVELAVTFWNVLVTVDGFVSEKRNVVVSGGGGVGSNLGGSGGAGSIIGGSSMYGGSGSSSNNNNPLVLVFDSTGVFIGGLPGYFNSRLGELTLPSVVFEPRFRGAVRNLVYGAIGSGGGGSVSSIGSSNSGVVKPQEIVESKGLISGSATSEACERHDPCLHGGFCISTDMGPVCDCKHIDFEGVNCEVEKSPTSATFHGSEYIGYDFRESGGHQPIISQLDEISLYFKTSTKNRNLLLHNLLFYSGDGVDYIALTIRNGQLMLSINLGSGPLDTKLHPDHLRFDDGEWHSVRVHRKIQEITASVDGIHFDRWTLAGSFTLLSSNRVTVAGYDTLRPLNGIRGVTNFIGCLKKVEYRADTLRLNILELARAGNRLVTISSGAGRLVFACQESIDAFETGGSGSSIGGFVVDGTGPGGGHHPYNRNSEQNQLLNHHNSIYGSSGNNLIPSQHHHLNQPLGDNPITFTTPQNSFLTVPPYHNVSSHSTQITLKIRTTEPNGLVLYSSSIPSNLVAIELVEGHVILHMQASSSAGVGHTRIQATSSRVHDGEWHTIKVIRNGRTGSVSVDDLTTDFNMKSEGRSIYLGVIYLGNVPSWIADERVWSVGLGIGFVGCLKNVLVESTLVDLVRLANAQDTGGIRPYCQVGSAGECVGNPCGNNGKCTDGWGRYVCECLFVGYEGGVCQVDAPYLDFTDGAIYEFTNKSASQGSPLSTRLFSPTQAQDIRFRFKSLNQNAVLLSIGGLDSDFVEVRIGSGKLRVRVRLSDTEKSLTIGPHSSSTSTPQFNDNNWHVFQMSRRGPDIRVYVDDLPPVSATLTTRSATINPMKYTFSSLTNPFTGLIQSLSINTVEIISAIKLKRLKPVGRYADDSNRIGGSGGGVAFGSSIRTFKSVNSPIQFLPRGKLMQGSSGYLTLPQLKAYSNLRIRFKFRMGGGGTSDGVLFYNGASSSNADFVLVLLREGRIVFSMGFGSMSGVGGGGMMMGGMSSSDERRVEIVSHRLSGASSSNWIDVDIWWDGGSSVVMGVDQYVFEEEIRGSGGIRDLVLRLNGVLYVGGGVGDGFAARVGGVGGSEYAGFVGCIANVDLGGEGISIEGGGSNSGGAIGGGIVHGCGDVSGGGLEPYNPVSSNSRCTTDACDNGGRCVEELGGSVTCDCEMTSYTGPTCSLESTTYEFSSSSSSSSIPQLYSGGSNSRSSSSSPSSRSHVRPGVIQFTYQENREPTTLHDNIAFGFITGLSDAVLVRIESVKTTDYLEVELISGKLRATYNMYLNKDHTIGEPNHMLNDNLYHVVRFTRNGANATLQIDNHDIITTYPVNLKENLFNSIGVVTVGGRVKELKREVTIVRGFRGIVSGLVINGMHLLDMTMNGDPRIKVYGDVRKVRGIGHGTSQQQHHHRTTTGRNPYSTRRQQQHGGGRTMSVDSYVYNTGDFQRAQPASSSSTTLSDDLISSGDSHHGQHSRCMVTDDEDNEDCAGGASGQFTDDIITPVYIPTTRITTTITTTKSNQDSNMYFPCAEDDEDCVEYGSGGGGGGGVVVDGRGRDGSSSSSSTVSSSGSSSSSSSSSSIHHHHPMTTEQIGGGVGGGYYDSSSSSSSSSSASSAETESSTTSSSSSTTSSTTTSTSTTTRFTPPHPPSLPPYHRGGGPLFDFEHNKPTPSSTSTVSSTIEKKKKSYNETVYFADSGDSTLIIIIIIAVLMIIIVSILIIFFMCKRRDDPIYKIEQQQQQVHQAQQQAQQQQQQQQAHLQQQQVHQQHVLQNPNNNMRQQPQQQLQQPGGGGGGPGGPRKAGVKEWYV